MPVWVQKAWCEIPALPLTSCVTSGKQLNLSVPLFSHLSNGDNNSEQTFKVAVKTE